jgi:CHAT domain-containing protein
VSDLASAVLMKHFYRLLKIIPAAAALKAAQGEVRVLFPHPAYWAGFRLEGTGGEMK